MRRPTAMSGSGCPGCPVGVSRPRSLLRSTNGSMRPFPSLVRHPVPNVIRLARRQGRSGPAGTPRTSSRTVRPIRTHSLTQRSPSSTAAMSGLLSAPRSTTGRAALAAPLSPFATTPANTYWPRSSRSVTKCRFCTSASLALDLPLHVCSLRCPGCRYDTCCFSAHGRHDKMKKYEAEIRAELAADDRKGGEHGWFTETADNHSKHEVCAQVRQSTNTSAWQHLCLLDSSVWCRTRRSSPPQCKAPLQRGHLAGTLCRATSCTKSYRLTALRMWNQACSMGR